MSKRTLGFGLALGWAIGAAGCEPGGSSRDEADAAVETRADAGADASTAPGDAGTVAAYDAGGSSDASAAGGAGGSTHVVGASAGDSHTCAVMDDGTVRCWGLPLTAASYGLTGIVAGLAEVVEVAAGVMHTCARLRDGTVHCWGAGVAVSATAADDDPSVHVPGLDNVVRISAGGAHTCALIEGGTVRCWGSNSSGQVTADQPAACKAAPASECQASVTTVPGLQDVVDIAAGGQHSCAVLRDGSVQCWGDDFYGQTTDRKATLCPTGYEPACFEARPVSTVTAIKDATQISAGRRNTCVRRKDGSVRCWGASEGADATPGDSAINIGLFQGAVSVATGSLNTCVQRANKSVVCSGAIGSNLKEGGHNPAAHEEALATLADVSQITAGSQHACAVSEDGTLRCWGLDGTGQVDGQVPDKCDGLEGPCFLPVTVVRFD